MLLSNFRIREVHQDISKQGINGIGRKNEIKSPSPGKIFYAERNSIPTCHSR